MKSHKRKFDELVVAKELKESPSSLLEDVRALFKSNLLIEESYEDPYYWDAIHDHWKLLIQIYQVWVQHYWSDWLNTLSLKYEFNVGQNIQLQIEDWVFSFFPKEGIDMNSSNHHYMIQTSLIMVLLQTLLQIVFLQNTRTSSFQSRETDYRNILNIVVYVS